MKQNKSKINIDFKINLHINHKINIEIVHFIAGLEIGAKRAPYAKATQIMHNDFNNIFAGIGYFKGTFHCRLKMVQTGAAHAHSICITGTVHEGTKKVTRTANISPIRRG